MVTERPLTWSAGLICVLRHLSSLTRRSGPGNGPNTNYKLSVLFESLNDTEFDRGCTASPATLREHPASVPSSRGRFKPMLAGPKSGPKPPSNSARASGRPRTGPDPSMHTCLCKLYPLLRNSASEPEIEFPGQISAGL